MAGWEAPGRRRSLGILDGRPQAGLWLPAGWEA